MRQTVLYILYILIAADSALIIGMLTYWLSTEVASWNRRRRQTQIQRVQQELAEAQQQLQALALRHDTWLRDNAHEARKALIMESFHASREVRVGDYEESRCVNHNDV